MRPKKDLKYLHNLPENEINEFLNMMGAADFIIRPNVKKNLFSL